MGGKPSLLTWERVHGKGEDVLYTSFPVFSLQLIVLQPIKRERTVSFYSIIHEVVFDKMVNQS